MISRLVQRSRLELHAAPSHAAVEHVAVPDAVVVELAAVDVDVEALDAGVFDMRRAVHVAHQMHQILDADHDRRVVQRLVSRSSSIVSSIP